jgi:ArsR family transcriptional regulator
MNMIESSHSDTSEYQQQVQLLKALTHSARLAILDILREGEHCVCHMEAVLGFRQAYLSQQLAVLREIGIIQDRRDGWNIFYRVIMPEVFQLLDLARKMVGDPSGVHPAPSLKDCHCPKCAARRDLETGYPDSCYVSERSNHLIIRE